MAATYLIGTLAVGLLPFLPKLEARDDGDHSTKPEMPEPKLISPAIANHRRRNDQPEASRSQARLGFEGSRNYRRFAAFCLMAADGRAGSASYNARMAVPS